MNNEDNFNNNANKSLNDNMNNNNLQNDNNMNHNSNNYMDENEKNKNINRYYDMLDKSFGVLNSISNKCGDNKGKMKGGINYYLFKDPDYNELIQAQKNWVNKLPENIDTQSNLMIIQKCLIIIILTIAKVIHIEVITQIIINLI